MVRPSKAVDGLSDGEIGPGDLPCVPLLSVGLYLDDIGRTFGHSFLFTDHDIRFTKNIDKQYVVID